VTDGHFFDCPPYGKCWEPNSERAEAAEASAAQAAPPATASTGTRPHPGNIVIDDTLLRRCPLETWIGRRAETHGRKHLLLFGYGVLPIRGVLYTLTAIPSALIAAQVLDGVANAIYTIVAVLVIKDRTEGTGRSNLAAGALATMLGVGAALSKALGGMLVQHAGFHASFLGLAAIACLALLILWIAVPETGNSAPEHYSASLPLALRPVDGAPLDSIASPFASSGVGQ
jgi:MFS family permease